jgi:cbb3-type cytochrome oxidase maturation protein
VEIIVVLIPLSLLLLGVAAALFIWAVNNDQFEQLDRHGFDIFDDTSGDDKQ